MVDLLPCCVALVVCEFHAKRWAEGGGWILDGVEKRWRSLVLTRLCVCVVASNFNFNPSLVGMAMCMVPYHKE